MEDLGADPALCGLEGSPTRVVRIFAPQPRGDREKWEGEPEELAERVLKRLSSDKIITVAVD